MHRHTPFALALILLLTLAAAPAALAEDAAEAVASDPGGGIDFGVPVSGDGPAGAPAGVAEEPAPDVPASPEEAYVRQVYRDKLEREPDPEGLATYVGQLRSRKKNRRDIANDIMKSEEYRELRRRKAEEAGGEGAGKGQAAKVFVPPVDIDVSKLEGGTDEEFVKRVYQRFLKRAPDAGGAAGYLKALKDGSMTREDVAEALAGSDEAKVTRLMEAGRINSPEHESNLLYVRELYKSLLKRTPPDKEIAHWVAGLDAGIYSAKKIRDIVAASVGKKPGSGSPAGDPLAGGSGEVALDGESAKSGGGRLNDDYLKGVDEQPLKKLTWDAMWAALQQDIRENPDKYNAAKDGLSGKDPVGGWGPPIDAAYMRLSGYLRAAGVKAAQSIATDGGQRSDCIFVNRPGTDLYEEIHLFEYGGGRFATGRNGIKGLYRLEVPGAASDQPAE